MPHYIFIEGNIASGKSTLLENLQQLNGTPRFGKVQVIMEPLDKWQSLVDSNGDNILCHFYRDMERFAYSFQSFAFLSRVRLLKEVMQDADFVFIERSIWSDKMIFAENCYDQSIMSEIEWNLYNEWFSWMEKLSIPKNMSFLYLQTTPEVSRQRMMKRKRKEENGVTLEYLTQICGKHTKWLGSKSELEFGETKASIIHVDANTDYDPAGKFFQAIVTRLEEALPTRERNDVTMNVGFSGTGC
jgi:deoxyadenosine/deoxycytidine kinase